LEGIVERDEMRRLLEGIARESTNPNARVSAIRALRQLEDDEEKEKERSVPEGMGALYAVKPHNGHENGPKGA
jgi:hypothetical protein